MAKISLRQAEDRIFDAYEKAHEATVKFVRRAESERAKGNTDFDPHSHEAATNTTRDFLNTVSETLKQLTED